MKLSLRFANLIFLVSGALAGCDPVVVTEHLGKLRPKPTPGPNVCECGPDRPEIACANGKDNWQCRPSADDLACRWVLECSDDQPAPPPCAVDACGDPAPRAATIMCADGSVAGPACVRKDDGCVWDVLTCDDVAMVDCKGLDEMTCAVTPGCSWFATLSSAPCGPDGCIGGGSCEPTNGGGGIPSVGGSVDSDGAGSTGGSGGTSTTTR